MYDVFVNFIKAACGLSKKSKEQIVDIDAADVNYELAVLEYVEDIYSFYKLAEVFIVLNLSFIFVSCILAISMINSIFCGSLQSETRVHD